MSKKQPPASNDLTIADIKSTSGFESITDDLAQQIADAIKAYTEIIYECYSEGRLKNEETKIIHLPSRENKVAA